MIKEKINSTEILGEYLINKKKFVLEIHFIRTIKKIKD